MKAIRLKNFSGVPNRTEVVFTDPVQREFICQVCNCLTPTLKRDRDLHGFCSSCYSMCVEDGIFTCEVDGNKFAMDGVFQDDIYDVVKKYELLCFNDWCEKRILLQDLKNHLLECSSNADATDMNTVKSKYEKMAEEDHDFTSFEYVPENTKEILTDHVTETETNLTRLNEDKKRVPSTSYSGNGIVHEEEEISETSPDTGEPEDTDVKLDRLISFEEIEALKVDVRNVKSSLEKLQTQHRQEIQELKNELEESRREIDRLRVELREDKRETNVLLQETRSFMTLIKEPFQNLMESLGAKKKKTFLGLGFV